MNFNKINQTKPKIYFIGIGGISMSALAKYLVINGYEVSGSDRTKSETTDYLNKIGCEIFIGHNASNIIGQDIIIYNSAIESNNVELEQAVKERKCIISRVELLQMIANSFDKIVGFSGSHGKTTTTSLFAHILLYSSIGFTTHIGGFDNTFGNLYQNGRELFATEICEYNKNIDKINANIAVVTNIDNDHLNCYKDFKDLKSSFYNYLDRAQIAVINIDDNNLKEYYKRNNNAITFSLEDETADYRCKILSKCKDYIHVRYFEKNKKIFDYKLKIKGDYNTHNSLCAIAVAKVLGISNKEIIDGLNSFNGIKRRNELIGNFENLPVFADYAHHPRELEGSIKTYKATYEDILIIFQPHTFSRTKLLFKDFIKVLSSLDNLFIYKTYPARELPTDGFDGEYLASNLNCNNYFENFNALIEAIKNNMSKYNAILVVGAGDLYDEMKKYLNANKKF